MRRIKLLLVDDEERFVSTLAERLRLRKCDTRIATSGEAALSEIKKEQPDIVLLDLKMPGMGGSEVLEKIKTDYPKIIVIMLTGQGDSQSYQNVLGAGAADCMVKPIDINNVMDMIKEIREKRDLD